MTIRLFYLLSSMTIFYELFWRQSLVVLCVTIVWCLQWQSVCSIYYLPWQSFMSSSEDSLLLSCVAVRCLTLSSSVFFYSLWTLLKTDFCCLVWQSIVLLWVRLCSFIRCELFWRQSFVVLCGSPLSYSKLFCVLLLCFICCMGFFLSTGIFVSWTLLLFKDSTSCNSKLKVSSYCTLSLRGDVRDIYWAIKPKPSVGPLIVIEVNRSS